MTDWNSGWTPPGYQQDPTGGQTSTDTGFDLSWLFRQPDPNRPHRPDYSHAEYEAYMKNDPVLAWIRSWGLPQEDPETKLAQLIAEKMGISLGATRSLRIASEQRIAREAAHRAQTDAAYRDQLAQSMGWDLKNPHVAYWIQKGGGVPADPTGPGVTSTGQGKAGTSTTTSGAATTPATIGAPFAASAFQGMGYGYMAVLAPQFAAAAGVPNNPGVDYDVPMGTPLDAMMAGTIVSAGPDGPYGISVLVKMANGYTYRYSHMESLGPGVYAGQTVAVGQVLGAAGMTGNASGPHVNIEMRDPSGKPIDPTPIVDSSLKGDLSATTGAQHFMNDYVTAGQSAGPILTQDGHLLYPGSQDYNVFFAAQQLWRKRYGVDPPWTFVSSLLASGQTTTEQVQNAMDQMSSDIPNMNWGQRDALTNDVNSAALKAWDRPLPDSTVKQLAALGITTPGQVAGWINSHPATQMDKGDYGQVFDAANPQTQDLWGQPPSPDLIAHIHKQMQAGPQA